MRSHCRHVLLSSLRGIYQVVGQQLGWVVCLLAMVIQAQPVQAQPTLKGGQALQQVTLTTLDGQPFRLDDPNVQRSVLLVVNTASKCGYTSQYAGLERLYQKYKKSGLLVLGFPSNDFGGQEPGDNATIAQFCNKTFQVTFPLFNKAPVSGTGIQPMYAWLLANASDNKAIGWNFEKFLISKDRKTIQRYRSGVTPEDKELVGAIERLLAL